MRDEVCDFRLIGDIVLLISDWGPSQSEGSNARREARGQPGVAGGSRAGCRYRSWDEEQEEGLG